MKLFSTSLSSQVFSVTAILEKFCNENLVGERQENIKSMCGKGAGISDAEGYSVVRNGDFCGTDMEEIISQWGCLVRKLSSLCLSNWVFSLGRIY